MGAIVCRFCRSEIGDVVLDLGAQPGCEYFPPLDDGSSEPTFPLRLWLCAGCGLAQLADDAEVPELPEGVEPAALVDQRRAAVAAAAAAGHLPTGATLIEGATPHGGSWWGDLEVLGLRRPVPGERADVVVDGTFGLMHASDQAAALDELLRHLRPDGVLLMQFHSLAAMLRECQWNAVRLGHYAYYSLPSLQRMFGERGLTITSAWRYPLYGGTVMVAARRGGAPDRSVATMLDEERQEGVLDPVVARELHASVETSTAALGAFLQSARDAGERVYGYCAASRAVAQFHLLPGVEDLVLGVADAATAKHGCRMPGTRVPVISPAELVAARPDIVLVLVPDLLAEARRSLPVIEAAGGRWVDVSSVAGLCRGGVTETA